MARTACPPIREPRCHWLPRPCRRSVKPAPATSEQGPIPLEFPGIFAGTPMHFRLSGGTVSRTDLRLVFAFSLAIAALGPFDSLRAQTTSDPNATVSAPAPAASAP